MKTFPKPRRHATAGFSLAEMMVVIVIIGLLVGVVAPNVIQKLFRAETAVARQDLTAIETGLEEYYMANQEYPESLDQMLEDENGESYFTTKSVPKDPWGMEYMYEPPSNPGARDFRVFTYGGDKAAGGEGKDADLDQNYDEEEQ